MATLTELTEKREVKSGEIRALWEKASKRASDKGHDGQQDFAAPELKEFQSRSEELDAIVNEYSALKSAEATFKRLRDMEENPERPFPYPDGGGALADPRNGGAMAPVKTLGSLFTDSAEYKAIRKDGRMGNFSNANFTVSIDDISMSPAALKNRLELAAKATMVETGSGFAPANYRTDIVVMSAQRRPIVQDYLPSIDTNLQVVKYMEETTFTNGAASTAENAAMGSAALAYTERSATVELIGTYLPVTEQQLADVPSIRGIIDGRLSLMQALTEETQLLSGTGASPQIQGFYTKAGIQSQALGADSRPDSFYKLLTLIRFTGYADPNVSIWNPNDWMNIRLLKDTQGRYIWGDPATVGVEQIWGVRVVQTPAATAGSPLTGDFLMFSHLWRNQGAQIAVGYTNDDFVKNQLTIKINSRMTLTIYRAAAFGVCTGF